MPKVSCGALKLVSWRDSIYLIIQAWGCLRPRLRREAGEVVDVSPDVHVGAFLDHHKHDSEVVCFYSKDFGCRIQIM